MLRDFDPWVFTCLDSIFLPAMYLVGSIEQYIMESGSMIKAHYARTTTDKHRIVYQY